MNIIIASPLYSEDIKDILDQVPSQPMGYYGAPFVSSLIRCLLNRGHFVSAVTTDACVNATYKYSSPDQRFKWYIVPARKHSFMFNGPKPGRALDFFAIERNQIVSIIQEIKPDIVHAHWSYEFASAAIDSGFPHVVTVHDNHFKVLSYMPSFYRLFRLLMAERNLRKLTTVSTVSPYMKEFLKNKVADVQVIPNPIKIHLKTNQINDLITKRISAISVPQIIMINNGWKGRKNGLFGLTVLKILIQYNNKIKLHLVGSDCEFGGVAFKDAKNLGVESSVQFHGRITNDLLQELLKDMHLLLHTAKEESFGVVLGEAAALGVPAIGYFKAGAVQWVINDDDLLYKSWDSDLVANQIISLLFENHLRYKNKCIEVYNKVRAEFSVEKVVSAYENYYTKILSC